MMRRLKDKAANERSEGAHGRVVVSCKRFLDLRMLLY